MSSYLIVHATVKDPDKLKRYGAAASQTVRAHGGEIVTRAQVTDVLVGDHEHNVVVLLKFPDGAALKAWYDSPEYQALVPLRDAAADMVFIAADEPS